MRPLALFDLDGTITDRDTFVAFLVHALGPFAAYGLLVASAPLLLLSRLGAIRDDAPKRFVLKWAFGGKQRDQLHAFAESFCAERLPAYERPHWRQELTQLKAMNARIIVVTASCSLWVSPWCRNNGLELLATELEWSGNNCTGKLKGNNCKGKEKVRRINEMLDMSIYTPIHAYGDTNSDRPMLELADHSHWRPFR